MVNCHETLLGSSLSRDSGFESAEDGELVHLSSDQLLKIRQQVEFYLSDEVVTKDQFLFKHVTKSKDGWLSLKLMSSFRKVKSLCKGYDWHIVADALKTSDLLEVNDDSSKVRRKIAISEEDETRPARTIVAYCETRVPTVESIKSTFASCGNLLNVKLLQPGEQVDEALRKVFTRHPKARQFTCSVIEFDKSQSVAKAQKIATDYRVALVKDSMKDSTKDSMKGSMKDSMKSASKVREPKPINRERRTFSDSEVQRRQGRQGSQGSQAPTTTLSWRDRQPTTDEVTDEVTTSAQFQTFSASFTHSTEQKRIINKRKVGDQAKRTPETLAPRRRFTISESGVTKSHVLAIRQPKGPDGSRGFVLRAHA